MKATKEQILASLTQEVNLLTEILQLKLKKAEMTTRGPQTSAESNPDNSNSQPETVKARKLKSKTKKGLKWAGSGCEDPRFCSTWIFPSPFVTSCFHNKQKRKTYIVYVWMCPSMMAAWNHQFMAKSDVPPPTLDTRIKCFGLFFIVFHPFVKLDDRSRPQMTVGVMSECPPSTVGGAQQAWLSFCWDCVGLGLFKVYFETGEIATLRVMKALHFGTLSRWNWF